MRDIFDMLTEQEGEGILKPLLREPDLQKLLQNPFDISETNIKVIIYSTLIQVEKYRLLLGRSKGHLLSKSFYRLSMKVMSS